jgi:hypothetical protein
VTRCIICDDKPAAGVLALFCEQCGKAYDRWNAKADSTQAALIRWVAKGARYWARKRAKGGPSHG